MGLETDGGEVSAMGYGMESVAALLELEMGTNGPARSSTRSAKPRICAWRKRHNRAAHAE